MYFLDHQAIPPEIICIQETWIYQETLPIITGYSSTHTYRINKKGGGSAIYIKNEIQYVTLNAVKFDDIEIEVAGIKCLVNGKDHITILSVYIAPSQVLRSDHLNKLLVDDNLIIMGDLNAKSQLWGSPIADTRGKLIENFVEENNLVCRNNGEGTRLNVNGSVSHLDII